MNVSGGYYERYKVKWDTGFFGDRIEAGARNLDFLAMPQVLLTRVCCIPGRASMI